MLFVIFVFNVEVINHVSHCICYLCYQVNLLPKHFQLEMNIDSDSKLMVF